MGLNTSLFRGELGLEKANSVQPKVTIGLYMIEHESNLKSRALNIINWHLKVSLVEEMYGISSQRLAFNCYDP